MTMKKHIAFMMLALFVLSACSCTGGGKYLSIGEPTTIEAFLIDTSLTPIDGFSSTNIHLAEYVVSFDIDFHGNILYVITGDDRLKAYDASFVVRRFY